MTMPRKNTDANTPFPIIPLDLSTTTLKVASASSKENNSNFTLVDFAPINPLPMQYLGSKGRISRWIIGAISKTLPQAKTIVDLFSGTGVVSLEAFSQGYQVILNDIQPYSYAILSSLFDKPKSGLLELAIK